MKEKRRDNRLPVNIDIKIEELYKQDREIIKNLNDNVHIINISKGGLAFEVDDDLPLGFYFNARISIDDNKSFFSVVKIIRKEDLKDKYLYGCEFVGLANVLSAFVDEYEEEIKKC